MHAGTQHAAAWWAKSRGEMSAAWIENYQLSLQVRHRTIISELIGELQPASVLEVGCHCGPNLIRIAQDHPAVRCQGFDVNTEAIQAGQHWAQALNCGDRVDLRVGRVPQDVVGLPTHMVDVVLTCYALAYLAPSDLEATLYELGRLATRAVILAEPMVTGEATTRHNLGGYTEWQHDYLAASKWVSTLNGRAQKSVPVEPPVDGLNQIVVFVNTP